MSKHLLRSQVSRGGRRVGIRGAVHLGLLFSVLIGINLYVFFFRDGSSVRELLNAKARAGKAAAAHGKKGPSTESALAPASLPSSGAGGPKTVVKGKLRGHNGLYQALDASKVKAGDIGAIVAVLRDKLDLRALQPRHTFEVELDGAGKVSRFTLHLSRRTRLEVRRAEKGRLVAKRIERPVVTRQARVGLKVQNSLEQDFKNTGESVALLYRVLQLFSWDINWTTDVRDGDKLRLVAEKQFLDGKVIGYGRVLAAEYVGQRVGTVRGFYHRTEAGDAGYYSPDGRSLKRKLLKVPLNFRRMSSGFDKRRLHPILHKVKAHLGVDYAAPPGTPIWAAGDGVVSWAKWAGPAGKMVKIRHEGVTSVYMHLSRIARGLRAGMKVKQRQVIGYVGTTGRSTGPHLHYGLQVRGRYIDPLGYPVPRGVMLSRPERERFFPSVAKRVAELESIPLVGAKKEPAPAKPKKLAPLEEDIWS